MELWYLPTVRAGVWPCLGITLLIFVPVTIWHERAWRRTLADYGRARAEAGATDPWPPEGMAMLIGVQPSLVLTVAALLAGMTALGVGALWVWPRALPFFDGPLNYFDRPYVASMVVAGTAGVVGALALGLDLARSQWAPVARRVRHCTHARPDTRERLFAEAIAVDPGVARSRKATAAVPPPEVPAEQPSQPPAVPSD